MYKISRCGVLILHYTHIPDGTAGIQQPAYVTGEENSTSPLILCAILRETTDITVVINLQTVDGTARSRFNFKVNLYHC